MKIKFRAWDKEGNDYSNWKPQMIYQSDWGKAIETKGSLLNPCIKSNRFIFMQYTGLKDKNDKEIYEGDIVLCEIWHGGVEAVFHEKKLKKQGKTTDWKYPYKIIYMKDRFELGYTDDDQIPADLKYIHEQIEIIGNIYQNKDLLND